MFKLKFVRVVEHDNGTVELERGPALTTAQNKIVEQFRRAGRSVVVKRLSTEGQPEAP